MEVYLNRITGIDDAIVSMFHSKRTLTKQLEDDIRSTCDRVLNTYGQMCVADSEDREKFTKWITSLTKWGWTHITMLRFIDFSFSVYGLHRAGQDDWDSHAKRFDNRIIRSSTRLANYDEGEMSDYYKDKIIPTDAALSILEIHVPEEIVKDGVKYVKTVNGFIREDMQNNKDVKRGLYMLSIPSNFLFKVNLTEWAHVYKERNEKGTANPEVKECCEKCADLIQSFIPYFDRELFQKIKN